jgi:D-tyrosyl-tRNA(Tyr) deacylase
LYEAFVKQMSQESGKPVQTGEFGADMKVSLSNDGPVTIVIDTKNRE